MHIFIIYLDSYPIHWLKYDTITRCTVAFSDAAMEKLKLWRLTFICYTDANFMFGLIKMTISRNNRNNSHTQKYIEGIIFVIPFLLLPIVLCDPTDVIWR